MEYGKNTLDFIRGLVAQNYPTRIISEIIPCQIYSPSGIAGNDNYLYFGQCIADESVAVNYTVEQGNPDQVTGGAFYAGPQALLFYSASGGDDILFLGYKIILEGV